MLVPDVLVRARPAAEHRVSLGGLPRDAELLTPPVPRDAEETIVEVHRGDRRGVEPLLQLGETRRGPSGRDEPDDDAYERDSRERDVDSARRSPRDDQAAGHEGR